MYSSFIFISVSALIYSSYAYPGEYVPKSIYVLDSEGHVSPVAYFRNKRDMNSFLNQRFKRGSGQSSASSYSGASASSGGSGWGHGTGYSSGNGGGGSGGGGGYSGNAGGYFPDSAQGFSSNLNDILNQAHSYASGHVGGGIPGGIPSGFPSGNPGFSASGASGHGDSGRTGSNGPQLFSRFGEGYGSGVHVSGAAQGPNGAFSSSHSSVDSDGKVKYSVQSGKY